MKVDPQTSSAGGAESAPLVSIVMSFRNAEATLSSAIVSLLWQTYLSWELILFNDGSTDGSTKIVQAFRDPRIRFIDDSTCRGLPARLNQGVSLAHGAFIARMDADDIAFPERLAKQVRFLAMHPEVDLLATSALLIDENNRAIGVMPAAETHEEICQRPWLGFPMPHPTWMGRKIWFQRHPYDETATKAQDQVLLFQAHAHSRFASSPDVLLGYRYGTVSLKKSLLGRFYYVRALIQSGVGRLTVRAGVYHAAAIARDAVGLALGMSGAIRGGRLKNADAELLNEWQNMQSRLMTNEKSGQRDS